MAKEADKLGLGKGPGKDIPEVRGSLREATGETLNQKRIRELEEQLANEQRLNVALRDENRTLKRENGKVARENAILVERNKMLEELSTIDPLTGIENRRSLNEHLPRIVDEMNRNNHVVMVVMVDIDHFKRINDTEGHTRGDTVLTEVAQALKSHVREYDVVARYGGEEFTLVFPEMDENAAEKKLEELRASVENNVGVTISLGACVKKAEEETTAGSLIEQADAALYQAKRGGRNRFHIAK